MNGDLPAIWPHLTDEESRIAQENLDRYIELSWEIYEDLQRQKQAVRQPLVLVLSLASQSRTLRMGTPPISCSPLICFVILSLSFLV